MSHDGSTTCSVEILLQSHQARQLHYGDAVGARQMPHHQARQL